MHSYLLNMRNEQMIHAKFYPFFKISRIHACKMTLFLHFANSRLPLKKYPLFRENGYERGIRFGREWRGRANMGSVWGRQDPGGPHVGPMNLAIWDAICSMSMMYFFTVPMPLRR